MDNDTAKRIRNRAIGYAIKNKACGRGGIIDPEDFAQFCCMYVLEHDGYLGAIHMRFADFMREQFGRVSAKVGAKSASQARKQAANLYYAEIWQGVKTSKEFQSEAKQDIVGDQLFFGKFFRKIAMDRRIIYILHHKYGFTLLELAAIMGLSEARICHYIKETQAQIKHNLK